MFALAFTFFALGSPFCEVRADELQPKGNNVYQLVTGDDGEEDRARWDALFNTQTYIYGKDPAEFLEKNIDLLPAGRVLDIAMGEGRNAVFLAKKGFIVDGVDISEVAMRKARRLARENNVSIRTINADLNEYKIEPEKYDVIVNINFLLRDLVPEIRKGLKKGGVVVFENHTIEHLQNPAGKSMPKAFLLKKGELKELFRGFEFLFYKEFNDGKSAVARLIARKPGDRSDGVANGDQDQRSSSRTNTVNPAQAE